MAKVAVTAIAARIAAGTAEAAVAHPSFRTLSWTKSTFIPTFLHPMSDFGKKVGIIIDKMKAPSAYSALMQRHRRRVWSMCWLYSDGDWERCRDLVQEVTISLWQHYGKLREGANYFEERAWVVWHTRTVLNHLHRKRHNVYEPLTPERANSLVVNPDIQDSITDELLAELSPADRRLVELRMEGYKASEIADELGIGRDAVYQRLHRIVEKLRDRYGYEK